MTYQESLLLQAILFLMLQKEDGFTRLEAIENFLKSQLSRRFSDLTVGDMYLLTDIADYEETK